MAKYGWLKNGEFFAVKLQNKDNVNWKQITQEIGLWLLCGKHSNLVPIIEARNFKGQIAIVSEYVRGGSLDDLLRQKIKFSVEEAVEVTTGILKGLQHIHENGIIHRDLKPANILLDGDTPRLTDFGISRVLSSESSSDTISGTLAYMAPECFDGKRNVQTDIWSMGIILYQLLCGSLPFPQKEQTALVGAIMMREPDALADGTPVFLADLVLRILSKDSSKRPNISSIQDDLEYCVRGMPGWLNRVAERTKPITEWLKEQRKATESVKLPELIPYRKGKNGDSVTKIRTLFFRANMTR